MGLVFLAINALARLSLMMVPEVIEITGGPSSNISRAEAIVLSLISDTNVCNSTSYGE
ncbi:MAG: hypothetical protein ACI93R_003924 [Flavobacteriales bacterium]|jgi:hypothetical protein